MTKSLKIAIISIVIVLLAGLIVFLFFYKNDGGNTGIDVIKNSLPFGEGAAETPGFVPPSTNNEGEGFLIDENGLVALPKLFQIHASSIAGFTSLVNKTTDEKEKILVRYLERGVGHIFETDLSTMQKERISNVTRLKINEALWGKDGRNVIIRYIDNEDEETIRTFLIKLSDTLNTKTTPGEEAIVPQNTETEGLFLPENIKNIVLSKNGKEIFYLIDTGKIGIGTIYNLETGKTNQIFRSPLTEWLAGWPNKKIITLNTKPSGIVEGVMYFLDINTEKTTKILSGINGLTTLTNPDGNKVVFSESNFGEFSLNLYSIEKRSVQTLPLQTLSEKCIWKNSDVLYCAVPTSIPIGIYPDVWYQGVVSFSDEIWEINTKTQTTKLLVTPIEASREEMDIINLSIDPSGEYLFFVNKKDLSLWGMRISI